LLLLMSLRLEINQQVIARGTLLTFGLVYAKVSSQGPFGRVQKLAPF